MQIPNSSPQRRERFEIYTGGLIKQKQGHGLFNNQK